MGRIKLVVFDLDGTLADTLPDIAGALEKVTAKYGAYGDLQQLVRKSIGNGAKKLVERVFDALGISKENLEADLAEYQALYAKDSCIDTVLYPNTLKVLEELKRRGIAMTVATMKPRVATAMTAEKPKASW